MSSSGVEFEEDKFSYGTKPRGANGVAGGEPSKMAQWLMDHGLAKSAKSAQYIMIGVIIACLILTYLVYKMFS
jgi:hypothetical protein